LVRTCSVPRGALCGKKRKSLIYLVSPLGVPTANNIKLLSSQTSAKATTGGKREFKSSQQANVFRRAVQRYQQATEVLDVFDRAAVISSGGNTELPPEESATLAELVGYKMKGYRLKKPPSHRAQIARSAEGKAWCRTRSRKSR
jgi:hypothetical protein